MFGQGSSVQGVVFLKSIKMGPPKVDLLTIEWISCNIINATGGGKTVYGGTPKIREPPLKFTCDATKPLRCRHFSSAIFSDQRSPGNDELPEAGPQVPGGAGGQSGHPVVSQCQQVSGDVIHAWGIFPSGAERSNSIWLTTARR